MQISLFTHDFCQKFNLDVHKCDSDCKMFEIFDTVSISAVMNMDDVYAQEKRWREIVKMHVLPKNFDTRPDICDI